MPWITAQTPAFVNFLKKVEAFSPNIYLDSKGYPTAGYGHLIYRSEWAAKTRDASVKEFITLCNKLGVKFTFRGAVPPKTASDDEIRQEIANLVSRGTSKADAFRVAGNAATLKAMADTDAHNWSGLEADRKIIQQAHNPFHNMGASWYGNPTKGGAALLMSIGDAVTLLKDDAETKSLVFLRKMSGWTATLKDREVGLQILAADVIFNQGAGGWKSHWQRFRDAAEKGDWKTARTFVQTYPSDAGPTRRGARLRLLDGMK